MSEKPTTRAANRIAREPSACQRCRRRKQKCDLKLPQCSNCSVAQARCMVYNAAKQAEVPRDYILLLEAQVTQLRSEISELRARTPSNPSSSTPGTTCQATIEASPSGSQDWMNSSLGRIVCEPSVQSPFFGVSSGIALARLVMSAVQAGSSPSDSYERENTRPDLAASSSPVKQATLPPRHAANHLVEVYFQFQTPHSPIVERPDVDQAVDNAYSARDSEEPDVGLSRNLFVVYMVFAISLCSVDHPSGARPPQSVECFNAAIDKIEDIFTYSKSNLETLRATLLLCQYIALCPSRGSLWLLTGTALRLAIDLGLHWETDKHINELDPRSLNDRRCLWWSAYLFDRLLCITLGRPFGIADQSINVPLPDLRPIHIYATPHLHAIHIRRAHNSLITMARMESEIKYVLYGDFRHSSIAYPKPDYHTWICDIEARLDNWYAATPSPNEAHFSSAFASQAFWDATYNNTLLFLYRPSPIAPQPSLKATQVLFEAACRFITSTKTLHRERRMDIMWKWVHHLFMAGLSLLYCIWNSQDLQDRIDARKSIASIQTCASTLAALSERWSGAGGCRDTFETLSSITVDLLITNNTGDTGRSREVFEQQLQELQQQIPPLFPGESATSDALAMLSMDGHGFGETLNTTAQWPESGCFDLWG